MRRRVSSIGHVALAGSFIAFGLLDDAREAPASPGSQASSMSGGTAVSRPLNLDPRIPWLADIGLPESGGPVPFVPSSRYEITKFGYPRRLVSIGQTVAMVCYRHTSSGSKESLVGLRLSDGVSWTRTLHGGIDWGLVTDGRMLYAVPAMCSGGAGQCRQLSIIGFDDGGTEVGHWAWPLADHWREFPHASLDEIRYRDGSIMGEGWGGMLRFGVPVRPGAVAEYGSIVTMEDFAVDSSAGGGTSKRRGRFARLFANPTRDVFPDDPRWRDAKRKTRELAERRAKRTSRHLGIEYPIDQLPWFTDEYTSSEDSLRVFGTPRLVYLGDRGDVVLEIDLGNPHKLPAGVAGDLKRGGRFEFLRLFAFYEGGGRLRTWIIFPPEVEVLPQENGEVFAVSEDSGYRLTHWVALKSH